MQSTNEQQRRIRTRGGCARRMIWTRGGRLGVNVRNVRNRLADGHNDVETDDEDDEERARNNQVRGNFRGGQGRGRVIRNVRVRARGNRGQRGVANVNHSNGQWQWEVVNENEAVELKDFPFIQTEGVNVKMQNNNRHAINYVYLYLTDQILQHIINETNRYAKQYVEEHPDKITNNYTGRWTPIDVDELKIFWGLILLTGIIKKPAPHLYWSTKGLYNTPVFSKIMKRDQFLLILKFLHFNNNRDPNYDNTDENRDRLHKVCPPY